MTQLRHAVRKDDAVRRSLDKIEEDAGVGGCKGISITPRGRC